MVPALLSGNAWRYLSSSQLGAATGVSWVESSNAATHSAMHGLSLPPQQTIVQPQMPAVPQLRKLHGGQKGADQSSWLLSKQQRKAEGIETPGLWPVSGPHTRSTEVTLVLVRAGCRTLLLSSFPDDLKIRKMLPTNLVSRRLLALPLQFLSTQDISFKYPLKRIVLKKRESEGVRGRVGQNHRGKHLPCLTGSQCFERTQNPLFLFFTHLTTLSVVSRAAELAPPGISLELDTLSLSQTS